MHRLDWSNTHRSTIVHVHDVKGSRSASDSEGVDSDEDEFDTVGPTRAAFRDDGTCMGVLMRRVTNIGIVELLAAACNDDALDSAFSAVAL